MIEEGAPFGAPSSAVDNMPSVWNEARLRAINDASAAGGLRDLAPTAVQLDSQYTVDEGVAMVLDGTGTSAVPPPTVRGMSTVPACLSTPPAAGRR